MSICTGTEITAPKGFRELVAGASYYFIRSSPRTRLVLLIQFVMRPPRTVDYGKGTKPKRTVAQLPLLILVRLARVDWESGLSHGHIVAGRTWKLPPWLDGVEGVDLAAMDASRVDGAKSHRDRVDDKLCSISALMLRVEELLDAADVEKIINRHARSLTPPQNETRTRLTFFTYITFGRNRNALHYPVHRLGRWDRMASQKTAKRGAPGHKGKEHGHNTTADMHKKIIESYLRHAGTGVTDEKVYVNSMRKDFGCKTRWSIEGGKKFLEIYHPAGDPFPLKGIFFYYVNLEYRPHLVRETRMGHNRARSKINPTLGSFTEHTWNLMQNVSADAYRVYDLPKGYIEGSDLPPLVVVVKRDAASGKKTGIGFSQGSEVASAYRMATFCEAIGLEAFGRLLGLKAVSAGSGVSPADLTDRGPGATAGGLSRNPDLLPVIRRGAPAYSGQSKALIETSHPKTPSDDEAPSFRRSNMTVIALARRELGALLLFNEATDMSNRVDPELEHLITRLTPNGLWEALDSVGRNDSVPTTFDDAARAYLEPVPAVLRRDGLEVAGRNYYSKSEFFQEALSSVAPEQDSDVKAYVVTCCTRHVWFEWQNRLIELDVRYPVPVSEEVKHMSLEEAVEYYRYMEQRKHEFKEQRRAAGMHFEEDFEVQTGTSLTSGKRVAGRPKRGSGTAKAEAREAKLSAAGRKAA